MKLEALDATFKNLLGEEGKAKDALVRRPSIRAPASGFAQPLEPRACSPGNGRRSVATLEALEYGSMAASFVSFVVRKAFRTMKVSRHPWLTNSFEGDLEEVERN